MEPAKEAINVRLCYLYKQIFGSSVNPVSSSTKHCITRESLLDALTVLCDECNNDALKKSDQAISKFVDKYRPILRELKQLRVNISDFDVKNLIGRGYFGEVHVVREKCTGDIYAMKTLKKDMMLQHQSIAFFEEERDIMALSKSDWLVKLQYAFQDSKQLYLIMEYCPGGDLAGLLERRGRPLTEKKAIFYIAEIVQAIRELHSLGFVHRDVKPDNVLLDRCGHLKLADFGSATRLSYLASAASAAPIGTTNYIAPEILMSLEKPKIYKHGPPCDYWSIGIIAYELITCKTPFAGDSKDIVHAYGRIIAHGSNSNIVHLKYPIEIQNYITNDYKDLVNILLHPVPAKRPDHSSILTLKAFEKVNWNQLRQEGPPFVPKINGYDDTSNFLEVEKRNSMMDVECFKTKYPFSGKNLPFIGFTYLQNVNFSNYGDMFDKESVRKESDSISSSGHSSGSHSIFNTSLNGTAICLSNAKETEKLLESRKKEIDALHKQLAMTLSKQKLLEDKEKRMIDVENARSNLEKDLAEMACKNQKLQHQLESEHKERKILETKSLQLIRGAKRKWKEKTEIQVSSLNQIINQYELKETEYNDAVRKLDYLLQTKTDSLAKCMNELESLRTFKTMHKENVEKVRVMSRRSVAEVDRVSQESNLQIKILTQKLNDELESRKKLQTELQNALSNFKLAEERESNLLNQQRKEKDVYGKEVVSWSQKLNKRCEEIFELNNIVSELKSEVEELSNSNKQLVEREEQLTDEINDLRNSSKVDHENNAKQLSLLISSAKIENKELNNKLLLAAKEKTDMKATLEKAIACEENHREKVTILEESVNRLQQEVANLENINLTIKTSTPKGKNDSSLYVSVENIANSERICVLQEQITKLEEQLKTSREECVLTKQEARKANSSLWKKEKELSDCDLDRRFAERELKETKSQLTTLQNELKKVTSDHETALSNLQSMVSNKEKELETARQTVTTLNSSIADFEKKIADSQRVADKNSQRYSLLQQKMTSDIQSLNDKIEKLESDLQTSEDRRLTAENAINKYSQDNKTSETGRHCEREQRIRLEVMLQERNKECDTLCKNYKLLQEACTVLEEQLIDFEKVIEVQDCQNDKLKEEIKLLNSEIEKMHSETSKLQKSLDVQKFNVISSDSKSSEIAEKLQRELSKNKEFEKQMNMMLIQEASLSSEMNNKSIEIAQLQSELKIAKVDLNAKNTENASLKEECTHLLTNVATLRENNMHLQLELKECKENISALQILAKEFEEELSARQFHWQQCELKAEATISQQIKLIDFLQTKVEEVSKRKKTFGDMLFGKSNSKEIIILPSTPQTPMKNKFNNDDEQSKVLLREKIRNKELQGRVSTLQEKLKLAENTPNADNYKKDKVYVGDILMDGWVRIQNGKLLVKVYMKLFSDSLKWQDGDLKEFSLIQENLILTENLQTNDTDLLLSETEKKYAFKIRSLSEQCLLIVCSSPRQKEDWVAELKKIISQPLSNESEKLDSSTSFNYKPLIKFNKSNLKLTFMIELMKNMFLIGSEKSLFYFCKDSGKEPFEVTGMNGMQKVHVAPNIDQIIFLDNTGQLLHTSLRQFVAFLKSQNYTSQTPPNLKNFNGIVPNENSYIKNVFTLFEVSPIKTDTDRVFVSAVTSSSLFIYEYENLKMSFRLLRNLKTETISCMRFTPHTIIVGSHKFYEIDLKSFKVEEFLDPSDVSLSHAVYAYKKEIYPMAIVQTKNMSDKFNEYLLCYGGFGVFVDEYGQRSRSEDVKWTHCPSKIVYRRPFVFIIYHSSVEIVHLENESFHRNWSDRDSVASCSSNLSIVPKSVIIDFSSPHFLGKALTPSSVYISLSKKSENLIEILELKGNDVFLKKLGASIDTLDTIDDIDSCKNLQNNCNESLSIQTDSDFNLTETSSIETKSDFSSKIKEKAKIINSLKYENNKVNTIQELICKKSTGSKVITDESDSSGEDSDISSSGEENIPRKFSNQSNSKRFGKHVKNNILKENNAGDMTPLSKKQVRFN